MKRQKLAKYINDYTKQILKNEIYNEANDTSIRRGINLFGSFSKPSSNLMCLPKGMKVEFIEEAF